MFRRTYLVLFVVLMAALVLAACGGGAAPTATPVPPTEPPAAAPTDTPVPPTAAPPTNTPVPAPTDTPAPAGTLRIWADDTRAPILQALAPDFLAAYNIELVVELKSAIRDDFQVAAPVGEGPDIIVIAHDQAGTLVDNGLLAEVDLCDKADQFAANALAACTFGGKLYCMPYATENMAFFYNTDLVPKAPTTWDEVMTVGKALMDAGKTTYVMAVTGTTYDAYPLFTAFGGYIFGRDADGNWDPQDLGVDSEGMIAGVKFLADGVAAGEFPRTGTGPTTTPCSRPVKFPSSWLALGPWIYLRPGVPYAIITSAGCPRAGNSLRWHSGLLHQCSQQERPLAQAFLTEFDDLGDDAGSVQGGWTPLRLPARAQKPMTPTWPPSARPSANTTMMPAIPAMGSVWGNSDDSVVLARDGKQDAETAMKAAGTKIL
ncbi:MAG: extracellular solute-binding protein [Caldilineales bacterium]|nr:extracellular solute-binding protein [Caldilineales bacterium]